MREGGSKFLLHKNSIALSYARTLEYTVDMPLGALCYGRFAFVRDKL